MRNNPTAGIKFNNQVCHWLVGQKFGRLRVLSFSSKKRGQFYWNCFCDCGKTGIYRGSWLIGEAKSCGCLSRESVSKIRRKNLLGQKIGNLTVIKNLGVGEDGKQIWLCRCICGKEVARNTSRVSSCSKYCTRYCPEKLLIAKINKKYNSYQNNAFQNGREFSLSKIEFTKLVRTTCYYCGFIKSINGIDRKDNLKGYTKKNSIPCCKICNQAKHTFKFSDFIKWLDNLAEFRYKIKDQENVS